MKEAKVYIGIVLHDSKRYIFSDFISNLKDIVPDNAVVFFVDNSEENDFEKEIKSLGYGYEKSGFPEVPKEKLSQKRNITHLHAFNKLISKFLSSDCTHFLSLECDIMPPSNIVNHLLGFDKQIVGQWYNVMFDLFELHPCIHQNGYKRTEFLRWTLAFCEMDELTGGLMKVKGCGVGCLLMKREVLEKVGRVRFYKGFHGSVDVLLMIQTRFHKFPVFVDSSFKLCHVQGWVKNV